MNRASISPLAAIRLAFSFLTRLPVGAPTDAGGQCPPLSKAVWAFPIVGAVVGGLAGLTLLGAFALGLHSVAAVLFALAISIAVSGALHEDGLADVADGFGGGRTTADKLTIMRDSRIGSYGVLALILSISLRVTLLSSVIGPGTAAMALVASGALSRAAMVPVMALLGPARSDGLGAAAGRPSLSLAWLTVAIAAVFTMAILWPRDNLLLEPWAGAAAIAAAMGVAALVGCLAQRQIGGQTGDVLGCAQQSAEVAALTAIALAA